jgi:replicative DNA helicase
MADGTTGHVPPHDLDAEKSVLASILLEPEALGEVEAVLSPGEFYYPTNATIFDAMRATKAAGAPVDLVTVKAALEASGRLAAVGGVAYLASLTDGVVTSAHVVAHARLVADLAQVRRIVSTALAVTAKGFGDRGNVSEFVSWAEKLTASACERRTRTGLRPLGDFVQQSFERLENAGGDKSPGIATGFHDVDALTHGVHNGQLVVIAGRPRMGKSSLALNVAHNVANRGIGVAIWSQEMPGREWSDRALASSANVDQSKLRGLTLSRDEFTRFTQAGNEVFQLPVWIDEGCNITLSEIASKARRIVRKHGVRMLVVDHLGLMDHERSREERSDEAIGRTTRGLKALAKELDVPVVLLCQLNRECEKERDKRPQLAHLRGTGDIEQDADVVMFIYRDEVYHRASADKGVAELHVAKQRNGPEGIVRLAFNSALTRFESLAENDARREAPEPRARAPRRERKSQRDYYPNAATEGASRP